MTKKQFEAKITDISQVANDLFLIKFMPESDFQSKAGQFVSILIPDLTMRRPFSILGVDDILDCHANARNDKNEVSVLFKKKGRGTEYLSSLAVGDSINFIGAIGNSFDTISQNQNLKSLLIGAGVGVAPIFYLKKQLPNSRFLAGFQTKSDIPNFMEFDFVTTDDKGGSIVNYIEKEIETYKPEIIYSCGPTIVMKLITQIAQKHNIPSIVSMEKLMACSLGVCRGCVIELKDGDSIINKAVCKDGPVFRGEDIIW